MPESYFHLFLALAGWLSLFVCGLILVRNEWVFGACLFIIKTSPDEYENYLDYDEMMRKFWIWDIEKLKKPTSGS